MKVQIDPRVAFCSIVAVTLMAGCDDSSSKKVDAPPAPAVECTSNSHCADRTDGKTECDMVNNVCFKPGEKPECTKKSDCANRADGKTDCDLSKKVCVKPQEPQDKCGNGSVDEGESCDGSDLGGKSCSSWNGEYVDGQLACNSTCGYDTTGCVECTETDLSLCDSDQICSEGHCADDVPLAECGNGTIEEDEDCENGKPISKTCADLGDFVAGNLSCDPDDCTYDISECVECTEADTSLCGSGEICDNGFCKEVQTTCGDGKVEGDEKCDGQALNGKSCSDFDGFVGGDLACNGSCDFDTSGCVECTADNTSKCDSGEICNESGHCVDPGHEISCGDGIVEGDEQCEDTNLNGKACADVDTAHPAGVLKCTASCTFDTALCVECTDNSHCAKNTNGKTICQKDVCVAPEDVVIPKVVISQIYPGGGLSGATHNTKFVELLNIDEDAVDISGWSIQYGVAGQNVVKSSCVLPKDEKTTNLPKGGYYLVALKSGSTGAAIPEADATCASVNPNSTDGKFFLVNSSKSLATTTPEGIMPFGIVDMVGYGDANYAEGTAMTTLSNKKAGLRKGKGCIDTNDNSKDFDTGTATPRNFSSALNLCEGPIEPVCGNSELEDGEDCDGTLFRNNKTSCRDYTHDPAYVSGTVSCNACAIDYSNCKTEVPAVCGNSNLETSEDCDGTLFKGNKMACSDWDSSYVYGNVSCNACAIDYSDCKTEMPAVCGNSNLETSEDCDGTLFRDNKTACSEWNSNYVYGNVSCSACAIDYSNCKTEMPAVCGNSVLETGEDCDGSLFKDNKKLCAEWKPGEYNRGEVKCNACNLDYSGCSYIDPSSCLEGQEWSDKYATCVYPIASADDLKALAQNWKASGRSAYPMVDDGDPVFLLKDDISVTSNTAIGTLGNKFEAVFYGDGHTINFTLMSGTEGLFGYTYYATIQDLNIVVSTDASSTVNVSNILANTTDHGAFKNINIKGTYKYYKSSGASYAILYDSDGTEFDDITIDMTYSVEVDAAVFVSPFMRNATNSTFNRVSLNGSYVMKEGYYSNSFVGFGLRSDSSKYTECTFNMEVNASASSYSRPHAVYILFSEMAGTTKIDRMQIKKAAITKTAEVWGELVDKTSDCTKCYISNLEDNTAFSNTGRSYFIYSLNNVYLVNSLTNSNFKSLYSSAANTHIENVLFAKQTGVNLASVMFHNVYDESNILNNTITPEKLNDNIPRGLYIAAGKYLPWYKDSKARFHLKFDASDDELIVVE